MLSAKCKIPISKMSLTKGTVYDVTNKQNDFIIEKINNEIYKIFNKYYINTKVDKVDLWKMHCILDEYVKIKIDNKYIEKKIVNSLFDLYQCLVSLYIYSVNVDVFEEIKTLEGYIRRITE